MLGSHKGTFFLFNDRYNASDCIGVHWIGFTQVAFGLGTALTAFTAGRLMKYIPQYFIAYTFIAINLGIVIFQLLWDREPSYFATFLILFE